MTGELIFLALVTTFLVGAVFGQASANHYWAGKSKSGLRAAPMSGAKGLYWVIEDGANHPFIEWKWKDSLSQQQREIVGDDA